MICCEKKIEKNTKIYHRQKKKKIGALIDLLGFAAGKNITTAADNLHRHNWRRPLD